MKNIIFHKKIRKLKSKPALKRKLKVFIMIGFSCLLVVGGLSVWAGFSAVKYVVTSTSQVISSPISQNQIQNAKTELQKIELQSLSCWRQVQSLISTQPWFERPALDNLKNLKVACLESRNAIGKNVIEAKNTMEGSDI